MPLVPIVAAMPCPVDTPNDPGQLRVRLGALGVVQLAHLMDGRPVYVPGYFRGGADLESAERSPRVRFLVGQIRRSARNTRWLGPILLPGRPGRPAYVDPAYLAHKECDTCSPVWERARSWHSEAEFTLTPLGTIRGLESDVLEPPPVPEVQVG